MSLLDFGQAAEWSDETRTLQEFRSYVTSWPSVPTREKPQARDCATSREFAVPLGSSAWGLTRHLVALGLCVCGGIMMVLQESRRSIMIYADPLLPSAGLTCGNGR